MRSQSQSDCTSELDWIKRFAVLCFLCACAACAEYPKDAKTPATDRPLTFINLINHGQHTGLGIRRADIPPGLLPEIADFPEADYLELGWGDWDYYQTDDPGLWLTLKAALWPTASVLHVIGFKGAVAQRFVGYEVVRLELSPDEFNRLMDFIHRSVARHEVAKAEALDSGLYRNSHFYPALGKFHLFNTCNTWTARALETAGYPMGLFRPVTADQLLGKVRESGMVPVPSGQ